MDILTDAEINSIVSSSSLVRTYAQAVDSHSAYEILTARLEEASNQAEASKAAQAEKKSSRSAPKEESIFDDPAFRQAKRTAANILTRSLLGALGLGGSSRRRKKGLFG
jgi:hypothetical protein